MSEFMPTLAAALILATLSHMTSSYDNTRAYYVRKERLFFMLLSIVLILFVGLRTAYNDTLSYLHSYNLSDPTMPILDIDWRLGKNPGYNVIRILFSRMEVSPQSYLMFYAILTLSIYLWFIRKYTSNIWLSIFLLITVGNYFFTMAAIKQCAAIAFCLVSVDRAVQKKWISFLFWVFLGMLFHPYALMYLLTPFLMFRPWSGKTWALLVGFVSIGLLLQSVMGSVINITTMLGEEFNAEQFVGEGVNVLRFAVVTVPTVLSFVTRQVIAQKNDRINNLIMNLTMLNAFVMFVALFGTAIYFARLANYFVIFQVISLPWLFSHFRRGSRVFLVCGAAVCYLAFFYYENGVNMPLDYFYSSTTLMAYLKSIF